MPDCHIQKVLDGDKQAFRHIIKECKDGAYNLALSILKEEHAAQDALQRSFLKAYEHLETFRGDSDFKTWFHRIVVNEAYQTLRKRKPELNFKPEEIGFLKSGAGTVQNKIDQDHKVHFINLTLNRMKPDESLSLKLFYLEEHTVDEMTEITGWSKSKVKVTLHRARKSMKELLTDTFNLKPQDLY